MKKIEKEKRKNEYNIQSVNKHLINILEENYYIELGNVDIKVLEKLFSGHPVSLSEIYYFPITVNGIGQISNDQENDINYRIGKCLYEGNGVEENKLLSVRYLEEALDGYEAREHDAYGYVEKRIVEIKNMLGKI